ncbi:MAG: class I SAM-dependent methyltransferase [Candidatus Omnitrophota bacterium]|nr:class I SAM-dependent methyltransferase [Candidatus Omnitrophota bacterium]
MKLTREEHRSLYEQMQKEDVPCSLCDSRQQVEILDLDKNGMPLRTVICGRCGFIFTNPRPTEKEMLAFYRTTYRGFYTGASDPAKDYNPDSRVYKRAKWICDFTLRHLRGRQAEDIRILDVGCASGILLNLLGQSLPAAELYGIEPTDSFAAYARENTRAKIFSGQCHALNHYKTPLNRRMDVVTLVHVLEHMYNPVQKLREIGEFLTDGGLLVVEVPNILHRDCDAPIKKVHIDHVSQFIPSTLRRALTQAGFEVLDEFTDTYAPGKRHAMTFAARKNVRLSGERPFPFLTANEFEAIYDVVKKKFVLRVNKTKDAPAKKKLTLWSRLKRKAGQLRKGANPEHSRSSE